MPSLTGLIEVAPGQYERRGKTMILVVNGANITPTRVSKQMTGEKIPGDLNAWDYFGTDPNTLLLYKYNTLCERATTLYHTHPPVAAAINKTQTYAVGPGLKFRSQPDWKTLGIKKDYAKDWGMRFQALVHYAFLLLNFYAKQGVLFRTADIMGDSLLLFDRTTQTNGVPFDIIECGGDYINFQATAKKDGEKITLGILHDDFLRRKGIVLNDMSQKRVDFQDANGDQQVIQYYTKYMTRQLRGFPLPYRIIAAAKNNDRWWDATLQRAVLEAIMFATVKKTTNNFGSQADDLAAAVRNEDGTKPTRPSLSPVASAAQLSGGNVFQFAGDGEITFSDLKTPSNNFDKMQTAYIEMVGMGTDVPPEMVLSKYPTSFTAHIGARNDFVKAYTFKRNNFTNRVCNVTLTEVAKWLFMDRLIEMPHPQFFSNPIIRLATLAGTWLGPVPGHINPSVEVESLLKAKDAGFMTPADIAAQHYDKEWDNQIEEWGEQMAEWAKLSPDQQAKVMQGQEEELNEEKPA